MPHVSSCLCLKIPDCIAWLTSHSRSLYEVYTQGGKNSCPKNMQFTAVGNIYLAKKKVEIMIACKSMSSYNSIADYLHSFQSIFPNNMS